MANKHKRARNARGGLTVNQIRKLEYAKKAAAAAKNRPQQVQMSGIVPKGKLHKTNHKKGIALAAKAQRREEGLIRNAQWQSLHLVEQLERLDARLGKGQGAVKQRAKIAAKIEQQKHPVKVEHIAPRQDNREQRIQKQARKQAHDQTKKVG